MYLIETAKESLRLFKYRFTLFFILEFISKISQKITIVNMN